MTKGRGKNIRNSRARMETGLPKSPSGIRGLDEITRGGLPKGRTTLVCGGAGCGKTLFAMEFIVRGAMQYDEPGVFVAFEENAEELARNVASLGFDLDALSKKKKIILDYVYLEKSEIEETGEYDLEGLFIRLDSAIKSVGAKRVVLDTIETLFSGLPDENILRAELRRLFRWLKERGVTAVVTGELGDGIMTRHGIEEYVSDCVILLSHKVTEQVSTRRLRVVKYRGSIHGTNEYPFIIEDNGISVIPVTTLRLEHRVTTERISTGIPRMDAMLGGKGYYRGASILISGTAGTGKTSLAVHLADSSCRRGEKCLFMASEESSHQIIRNARSIGLNLDAWVKKGLLDFHSIRPTAYGLEMHLATMHKLVEERNPKVVIFDPISNLPAIGTGREIYSMLIRLLDFLKSRGITTLCTCLTHGGETLEQTDVGVSSIMDTWVLVRDLEYGGERTRLMYVLKSRGMPHSNQMREFLITDKGIDLRDVYAGAGGVFTGSARKVQEMKDAAEAIALRHEGERLRRELLRKQEIADARIRELQAELESQKEELRSAILQHGAREKAMEAGVSEIKKLRKADR